jgi:Cof subfamily protein (haloacid dehalogenase superfamily)
VPSRAGRPRFKLIAVDLDGTLLDHRGSPHERDVLALRAAQRAGINVSILTGRLYSGTRAAAAAIGVTGAVGCADGSHIVRASDHQTLVHHGLLGVSAHAVRDAVARNGPAAFVFARDTIVHDSRGEAFLPYVRTWSLDVLATAEIETHEFWSSEDGITAVVAVGSAEQIHGTGDEIERALGAKAQVATFPVRRMADTWGLIARAAGGTKGSALTYIAEQYGCTPEETVCVGDWLNDVSMFGVAGRSYAMGHAPDEVKRAASAVLIETSERGGGIARVIEEAFEVRVE